MQSAQFEVHSSVPAARSSWFEHRLEGAIQENLRELAPLPDGFKITFHNTTPQSTFGGWLPPARLTKDLSAQLSFEYFPSADDGFSYKSVRALETRQGGLFGESLSDYVGRMQELSHFYSNDVKYMRDLSVPVRTSMLCRCITRLLKEKGVTGCDVFAIQPPNSYLAEPTVPVVIAPAGELAVAAGILKGWLCHVDSDLSTAGGKGALVFFDRHPILVLPQGAMSHFGRTEPSVFRTPLLYNFHPDDRLRAELSDTLADKYAVMR